MALDPTSATLSADDIPPNTFLIGNHADELSPWVPILATRTKAAGYLSIPCCAWSFDARFDRTRDLPYDEVGDEAVDHVRGDALADDDAQNLDVLEVGRELVVWHDPALGAEQRLHPLLLHVGVLLAVLLREAEGDDGQAGDVALDVPTV